ncbi:flagellar basal body rod C-terminal domain-containing protein, partial [Brevundimonas sp.]
PVQTDAGELIVNPELGPITVAQDGTITQEGEIVGRLSVVRFGDLSVLEKGGDNLYRNISNLQPIEAADARVRQGMLEGSNVNTLIEITNLVEINRAYESVTRMIENTNDLSRRAVERLGKVS